MNYKIWKLLIKSYYRKHISEENKLKFEELHNESLSKYGILRSRWYVSFQASKNIDEDFADNFALNYIKRNI